MWMTWKLLPNREFVIVPVILTWLSSLPTWPLVTPATLETVTLSSVNVMLPSTAAKRWLPASPLSTPLPEPAARARNCMLVFLMVIA